MRLLETAVSYKLISDKKHIRHPYRLIINVTGACQSLCLTCDWGRNYLSRKYSTAGELTLAEYERLFSAVPEIVWLSLGGGEPTMRKDLADIAITAGKKCDSLLGVDFSTNGLTPRIAEGHVRKMAQNAPVLIEAGISLDGGPDLHDKIRGIKGNYAKCMETYHLIKALAKTYPNIGVHFNHTISGHNTGHMPEFLDALKSSGIEVKGDDISISFANVGYAFSNFGRTDFMITDREAAIRDVQYLLEHTPMFTSKDPLRRVRHLVKRAYLTLAMERYLRNPRQMVIPCAAFVASCHIDAFGNVFPCTIWGNKMGNLREVDFNFDKIWNSEEAEVIRKRIGEAKCPVCWSGCESTQSITLNLPGLLPQALRTT